jgi:hypothetical protein
MVRKTPLLRGFSAMAAGMEEMAAVERHVRQPVTAETENSLLRLSPQ